MILSGGVEVIENQRVRVRFKDPLGRYYTKYQASELLVKSLCAIDPGKVLDLGSGDGALSLAARNQWNKTEIITVDVDRAPKFVEEKRHKHIVCDALSGELPSFLKDMGYAPDVAVCNPPFIKAEWKPVFSEIIEDANLSGSYKYIREATAEVLFLAQNLRLVRSGGKVGIIVPDGIVAGKKHHGFRELLLKKHSVESVTKLPRTAFVGTDAQAYVLIIKEGVGTNNAVLLNEIRDDGSLSSSRFVEPDACIERLDYGYHALSNGFKDQRNTIGNLAAFIGRGSVSSSERKKQQYSVFHTTDFPERIEARSYCFPKEFLLPKESENKYSTVAMPGDILLARVGRNLEDKICWVASGVAAVTDCVYVIRAPEKVREKIFESLVSLKGRLLLEKLAHGVSARQLAKSDLCKFPVGRW